MTPLGEVVEVRHSANHSSTQHSATGTGHVGAAPWGLPLLAEGAQDSRMALLPLCLHTRAQKPGGLGEDGRNVGELVTGTKSLAPEGSRK